MINPSINVFVKQSKSLCTISEKSRNFEHGSSDKDDTRAGLTVSKLPHHANLCGNGRSRTRGRRVVGSSPCATEDPLCEDGRCTLYLSRLKRPPIGGKEKFVNPGVVLLTRLRF
ncbi:hypothetical protein TNCV_2374761 [Trichonephila clavipes]|nr:hypothetical protein TNCV_2374761 [Trichonephila clavipes]